MSETLALPLVNLNNNFLQFDHQRQRSANVNLNHHAVWRLSPRRVKSATVSFSPAATAASPVVNVLTVRSLGHNNSNATSPRSRQSSAEQRNYGALIASMHNVGDAELRRQLIRSAPPAVMGARIQRQTMSADSATVPTTTPDPHSQSRAPSASASVAASARTVEFRLNSAPLLAGRLRERERLLQRVSTGTGSGSLLASYRESRRKTDMLRNPSRIFKHTQSSMRKVQNPFVYEEYIEDGNLQWSRLALYDVHRLHFWNSDGSYRLNSHRL